MFYCNFIGACNLYRHLYIFVTVGVNSVTGRHFSCVRQRTIQIPEKLSKEPRCHEANSNPCGYSNQSFIPINYNVDGERTLTCIRLSPQMLSFEQARNSCTTCDANLITIPDSFIEAFQESLDSASIIYVGAKREGKSNTFHWMDESGGFVKVSDAREGDECLTYNGNTFRSSNCADEHYFYCQIRDFSFLNMVTLCAFAPDLIIGTNDTISAMCEGAVEDGNTLTIAIKNKKTGATLFSTKKGNGSNSVTSQAGKVKVLEMKSDHNHLYCVRKQHLFATQIQIKKKVGDELELKCCSSEEDCWIALIKVTGQENLDVSQEDSYASRFKLLFIVITLAAVLPIAGYAIFAIHSRSEGEMMQEADEAVEPGTPNIHSPADEVERDSYSGNSSSSTASDEET